MAWIVCLFSVNMRLACPKHTVELTISHLVSFSIFFHYLRIVNTATNSTRLPLQMSVVMSHGKEEGKDGSHHQGDQLALGEAGLALSTMRVPVSHVCHLKISEY